MHQSDDKVRVDKVQARGGDTRRMNLRVLVIGLTLGAALLTILWVSGALTQDSVEGAGTATDRIRAQSEQGQNPDNNIGMMGPDAPEADETATTRAVQPAPEQR